MARGGTWTYPVVGDTGSLIPNGGGDANSVQVDQALYLPLFYSDGFGIIHAGAANA